MSEYCAACGHRWVEAHVCQPGKEGGRMTDAEKVTLLRDALTRILHHVEDAEIPRLPPNACTLCHTYRMIGWDALAATGNGEALIAMSGKVDA